MRRRALNRFTWPRYGLLDHGVFDEELQRLYPGRIEDAWRPFFAVATDLSTFSVCVMREGPLWQAIRASCSIPGVLPPFFDANGHMLVDGGVADNIPVSVMHSLKTGPNLVIDLRPRGALSLCIRLLLHSGEARMDCASFEALALEQGFAPMSWPGLGDSTDDVRQDWRGPLLADAARSRAAAAGVSRFQFHELGSPSGRSGRGT